MLRYTTQSQDAGRHTGREVAGTLVMVVGNVAYVVSVLWRTRVPWLTSLPWTAARVGLIGINFGMFLQLSWRRKSRHKGGYSNPSVREVDESSSSESSGSDEESHTDVLWDSGWRNRPGVESTHPSFHKLQPVTPVYPVMHCLSQGRSPQPPNRTVTYDLLQSTETSCSRTGEQDTELEFEADTGVHHHHHHPPRCPPLLHPADVPLPDLCPLTPEAHHHRVTQWVAETGDPDDEGHVMLLADEYRAEHSRSFTQPRGLPRVSLPTSRKNSLF